MKYMDFEDVDLFKLFKQAVATAKGSYKKSFRFRGKTVKVQDAERIIKHLEENGKEGSTKAEPE
jgi:hypothetical protein